MIEDGMFRKALLHDQPLFPLIAVPQPMSEMNYDTGLGHLSHLYVEWTLHSRSHDLRRSDFSFNVPIGVPS